MRMNAILKSKLREFAREIHVLIDKVGNDDDKAVKALIQEQACSLTHQPKIIRNQGSDQEGSGPLNIQIIFINLIFILSFPTRGQGHWFALHANLNFVA